MKKLRDFAKSFGPCVLVYSLGGSVHLIVRSHSTGEEILHAVNIRLSDCKNLVAALRLVAKKRKAGYR